MKQRPRLRQHYEKHVIPTLQESYGGNLMQVPCLEKIVINCGLGDAKDNAKLLDSVVAELARISGQKPVVTKARKSISNFTLREGMPVGVKVTLRASRMYEFLERLIHVAIPRIRDFRGLNPKGFDGKGNYSLGLAEQTVFPEIDLDKVEYSQGLNVTIVTTARNDDEGRKLLTMIGMPFRN